MSTCSQFPVHFVTNCNNVDLTKEGVFKQVNTCLANLQTSCVDILYLHAPDRATPIEETLEAIQQMYTGEKEWVLFRRERAFESTLFVFLVLDSAIPTSIIYKHVADCFKCDCISCPSHRGQIYRIWSV